MCRGAAVHDTGMLHMLSLITSGYKLWQYHGDLDIMLARSGISPHPGPQQYDCASPVYLFCQHHGYQ
eukprot:12406861-Karenia_brevis.AAC.1